MKHVFIVGLPRTGTKLVKNVLRSDPGICCRISNETWFFGDLFRAGMRKKIRHFGDMSNDRNVGKLVDYMYSGEFKPAYFQPTYWKSLCKGRLVDREWMEQKILGSDRSDRAIYSILMESTIAVAGDECRNMEWILGDKTPGHLYYVPTLLKWFPEARIIHTFRDPRAIMASEWKRLQAEKGSGSVNRIKRAIRTLAIVLYISVTWLYAARLHKRYKLQYPGRYYLSRYEDLVSEPEENVRTLCEFSGIQFSEAMLKPAMQGSSFQGGKHSGFDQNAIERWRVHLKPWMKVWTTLITRRHLGDFGYKP